VLERGEEWIRDACDLYVRTGYPVHEAFTLARVSGPKYALPFRLSEPDSDREPDILPKAAAVCEANVPGV